MCRSHISDRGTIGGGLAMLADGRDTSHTQCCRSAAQEPRFMIPIPRAGSQYSQYIFVQEREDSAKMTGSIFIGSYNARPAACPRLRALRAAARRRYAARRARTGCAQHGKRAQIAEGSALGETHGQGVRQRFTFTFTSPNKDRPLLPRECNDPPVCSLLMERRRQPQPPS